MASKSGGLAARLLLAGFAVLLSLGLVAGVGEWAVRRRERTRATVPGTMSMMFYRHSRLMHGLVRGTDYYGWVNIGRQGFRGSRDVAETPPDSVYRIIAVGGSTTFDASTSSDSATWPAQLERALNETAAGRYEVLNAGVPGFQVFDDLVRLELELHRYKPRLLILYQGHNDLFNTLASASRGPAPFDPRPGAMPAVTPWRLWLEHNSLLYHKLHQKWAAIRLQSVGRRRGPGSSAAPTDFGPTLQAGTETYARNMRAFIAVARSMGIDVLVPQPAYTRIAAGTGGNDSAVVALWRAAMPFAPRDVVWGGYARYDAAARAVTSEAGVPYVPVTDSSLFVADSYTYGDAIHFADEGARRFARHLAPAVRSLAEAAATNATRRP